MIMGKSTVLAYGFGNSDAKKLKSLSEKWGLRLRRVVPEEYTQPIGAFTGRSAFLNAPEPVTGAIGEMLVLADVSERQLEAFLSGLHTIRVGTGALKAVLTETNARWTGERLYRELKEERASVDGCAEQPQ